MKYVEKNRTVEPHSESLLFLYLQDENGVPVPNSKCKISAGPPPTGIPPYFVDDDPNNPNRRTDANGKFQFVVAGGAPTRRLDFFVQVIGQDGQPESDPIHFPFPPGQARWVIVTLAPEGAPGAERGGGGALPAVPDLNLDPRLASEVGVTVKTAAPANGTTYWKLISAQYQNPDESGGNVSIVCFVQDERGMPLPGQRVIQKFPGDQASAATDERGHVDFPMSGDSSFSPDRGEHGPYSALVDGLPSDQVVGMGLPLKRHVQYILTWRKATAGQAVPAPTTGTVQGKILNVPAGAQAVLRAATVSLQASIAADGSFSFANVTPGEYSLQLTSGQTIQSALKVEAGQTVTVNAQLPPTANGGLRGRVSSAPAGARLVLRSPDRTMDSLVAPDGSYSFTNVPPGVYSLTLSGVGVINPNLTIVGGQIITFDYPIASGPGTSKKVMEHYLLFGPGTQPGTLTNLILALDYIVRYAPVCGFSVNEAQYAEHVTIVGNTSAVSSSDEQRLRDAGCQVVRLAAADSYALENLFQQLLASGSPYPS